MTEASRPEYEELAKELRNTREVKNWHKVGRGEIAKLYEFVAADRHSLQLARDKIAVAIQEVCEPLARLEPGGPIIRTRPGGERYQLGHVLAAKGLLRYWFPESEPVGNLPQEDKPVGKLTSFRKELGRVLAAEEGGGASDSTIKNYEDDVVDDIVDRLIALYSKDEQSASAIKRSPGWAYENDATTVGQDADLTSIEQDIKGIRLSIDSAGGCLPAMNAWPDDPYVRELLKGLDNLTIALGAHCVYAPLRQVDVLPILYQPLILSSLVNRTLGLIMHYSIYGTDPRLSPLLRACYESVLVVDYHAWIGPAAWTAISSQSGRNLFPLNGAKNRKLCREFRSHLMQYDDGRTIVGNYLTALAYCCNTCLKRTASGGGPDAGCVVHTATRCAKIVSSLVELVASRVIDWRIAAYAYGRLPALRTLYDRLLERQQMLTEEDLHIILLADNRHRGSI